LCATLCSDGRGALQAKESIMRTMARRATRDQLTKRNGDQLPDGVGGTITGGAMEPIDLMEILNRSVRCVTRGGAVSGSAQAMANGPGARQSRDRGIELSDGSRISFASIGDTSALVDA